MPRTFVTRWLQALAACFCVGLGGSVGAHPLDPLTADEIVAAANVLLGSGAARPGAIFQSVELREPPKAAVLGGTASDRQATVFWRQNQQSWKSTVNLRTSSHTRPQSIPRSQGQLGLTITEVVDFGFVFNDPTFLRALALRGIRTPAQLQQVLVTPLTPGGFGLPEEQRRIVKAQMYCTEGASINLYARPIEGLQAVIDLDERRVLQVLDSGVVPVPAATHEFDEASVGALVGLRPRLKPLRMAQPDGVNFRIDGNFVEWQKWRFHVRFERRAGPVISLATYGGRSVLYQGSMAEIFVPYQDPSANWTYRTYMDEGEFGFGLLASPLALGLDVPANAVLRAEVGLTGIDAPKALAGHLPGENGNRHSAPVAAQLVAPYHSHHFSFRLDVDVDGPDNSFVLGRLRQTPAPGPRRSVWMLDEDVLASEAQGALEHESGTWRVISASRRNAFGQPTGYELESHDDEEPLLAPADYRRAAFIGHPLWVTAHDPDERNAAGDTPNQNPGSPGLPACLADRQGLVARDLVLWATLGHHHVTQAEDWPVMSMKKMSLQLRPSNFFDRNPALDLRRAPFEVRAPGP